MEETDSKLADRVMRTYPDASAIKIYKEVDGFLGGAIFYAEFESPTIEESERFCYLFSSNGDIELFEDSVDALRGLQSLLDRRRTFLQRLNEFELSDIIGAAIAIAVTCAFVLLVALGKPIDEQFTPIFSIIVGYYFGKNVPAKV